ncbi:uncharacterized protein FSUBG_7012 [Fusarium subglutinans]|uniref:Uncharacterized protein n=1 Tax=Gibberella subglutinans TaxID=42677 RepID=A0A8H5PWG7_GIBSU|nr:uncharacterized protein FSUBG_7012 [Fusarium subglutinans]KAF5603914.1 hypothetical protein FSUBG_7012 [Fusarium subglutinans]
MSISLEDLAPAVPVVSIRVPESFSYGPTVLQPTLQEYDETSKNGGYSDASSRTFKGFGFNTIFRPLSRNPKTITKFPKPPTDSSTSNLLQLNLTGETQVFSEVLLEHVPNRGLFDQADIDLIGRPYTQSIVDAMPNEDGTVNTNPPVIHFEPGLWMRVPQVEDMPELPASFCRMGSSPHGTTINAQGFQPARTSKGAPDIDATDITPLVIPQLGIPPIKPKKTVTELEKKRFDNQDAHKDTTRRLPQDLSKFIANGTITQEIINDPNTILRQANVGKDIIENTMFIVSTNAPPGVFGGGTSNIGFNIGSDEGKEKDASREKKSGNANAVDVTAQYWVSKIRAEIELDPSMSVGQTVSPASQGPRDAVPEFFNDEDVEIPSSKKVVTVAYDQIQYSQMVMLDFNGLKWPHVTVATLAPIVSLKKPILSSAIQYVKDSSK